jgi:putative transposase
MSMIVPDAESAPAGSAGTVEDRGRLTAAGLAAELDEGSWLDQLLDRVAAAGGLWLTGEGGFQPRVDQECVGIGGLQVELADHLGYEMGDPAGRGSPNNRNVALTV